MDVEYAPVALQALPFCFKLHESRTVLVPSGAAAMLRRLVVDVDKVVEEAVPLVLAGKLESIPFRAERGDRFAPQCSTRGPSLRTDVC